MNAPFGSSDRPAAGALVPSTGEFTTAWIAYGCYFVGLLLWWPSIVGLVISYVRRNEPAAGFISTHYRWLIRTFWWSTLFYILSLATIVAGAAPVIMDVVRSAKQAEAAGVDLKTLISIDWTSIFTAAGLATVGGIGILGVYLWLAYRLIRGGLRLGDAQPAP